MDRRAKAWRVLAVGATMALVLTGCGGGSDDERSAGGDDPTGDTVTIAFLGPLTGDSANLGMNARDAMRLAVDEANAEGVGPTIEIKEFDTAGDAAQAGTVKDQVIADDEVVAVVGPVFSGESKAVIPAFDDAGLAMISPGATNKDLPNIVPGGRSFHRVIADDALQASGVAAYITDTLEPQRVVFVHDNTEYGKPLTDDVAALVTAAGVTAATPAPLTLDPEAQDFSSTVNAVNSADPEVLFYGGYYAEAGRFKKQLTDAGFEGLFVSGDGSLDPGFIEAAGPEAAEGARLSCPCNLASADSQGPLKEFFDNHSQALGREPGLYSPEGYDAANIFIEGIRAGNTDRAGLLNYLEDDFTSYQGVSKVVEFAENGNITSRDFFVFEVKDGQLTPSETVTVG